MRLRNPKRKVHEVFFGLCGILGPPQMCVRYGRAILWHNVCAEDVWECRYYNSELIVGPMNDGSDNFVVSYVFPDK